MSDSQQYEKVSVSSDGVTVDKRFEEDEFPVPAIAFEISSTRSETVTVVVVDEVPEDVAVEDLGFHPEYGSEYWNIDEDTITFEREIETNSEYTTVYGIRATGTDNVEQFLTEPVIESVDPPLEESDVVDESGSDVVRDVISGDSDAVPGLEDDASEGDDTDADVDTLDLKDPNAPDEPATSDGGSTIESGGSSDSGGEVTLDGADTDSLVGALATEIRNGNVDGDDVKLLRKAFDLAAEDSGSVDARIQRLQTEVADLLAYTDALEEFLDENGMGDEIIEDLRDEVESFQSDLAEVRELASSHEQSLSGIEETVDEVESSMSALESDMDDVFDEVDTVQSEVDSVQTDVDTVQSDVDSVQTDVNSVQTDVSSVESEMDEVSQSVEDVESELENLESQVGDIDVEAVKGDIDDIEDEIEELKEWREQLSSVIGGS